MAKSFEKKNLEADEIHIWQINLNQPIDGKDSMEILSSDEIQKARKFYFEKDRRRYVIARFALREILADYLGIMPNQVRFSYNRYGKPRIDLIKNNSICFNVSHSQDIALIAVTRKKEIGIDIEFIDYNLNVMKTAKNYFMPNELAILDSLYSNRQTLAFFRGWTRKEAFMKAIGMGFSYSPKNFSVLLDSEETEVLTEKTEFQELREWTLMTLPSNSEFKAALAIEGKIGKICYYKDMF